MPPAFSSPGLSIRVLGELRVLRGGSALPLPPSKKTRALLGYLVLTEREHRRDRLCSLFWDVTDDPRGALRWSISKLRALCDEPGAVRIVSDHDAVSFRAQGAAIDWFEVRARAAGDALERLEFDELERLALEFRGELLSGLALEDFDEFQSWCVAQREQARLLHAGVLRALVRRSPSPERALAHARALLRVDSLSQPARALLIDLLGQLGLGAEVEQQYRTGRRLLSELSMSVTDELEEAYRRARRAATERRSVEGRTSLVEAVRALEPPAAEPRETAVVVANPAPAPESVPLVGRERECRELRALLDEAAQGSARVVVLSGDAGVGKSRLLGELALEGSRRGASVLVGQAYEVESGRPYGPWIDALRRIPRAVVGSRLAEELAVLVPEWAPERAARQTEEQLFGAVCDLVAARAHSAPPVIVAFDDAHWLDEPSSRLLHYVARLSRHRPLLVVLSARDGELFDNVAITRVLRSLRRDGSLRELALGPLSSDAIAEIAEHLQASAHAARIFAESAGNPLFAIELFRALPGGAQGVSGTLSTLIHDRVQALSEPAVEVLRWASVLGSGFDLERLERVSELPADAVASGVEALQRHGLIQANASEQATGTYRFSHDVVRRAVYAELSEPRRRMLHRRVAERLEPLLGGDETLAADVVHHGALAGRPEISARACLRAAQRCVRLFASTEAEALVRRAFYHTQQLPVAERVKLDVELWRVRLDARRPLESEGAGGEIERLGELALDHGLEDCARLAFHMLAWLRWEEGAASDALAFSLRAEVLSRNLTDAERTAALAESARCLVLLENDLSSAEALVLEAQARAARSGISPMAIPDALGMLAWHRGELRKAAAWFAEARAIARREADRTNEFQALEHALCVLFELDDLAAARLVAAELGELAAKLRGGSEAPVARVFAALLEYAGGAHGELESSLEALRAADAKQRLVYAQLRAAEMDLEHGRIELAAARAREALGAATVLSRNSDIALARSVLVRAARARGQLEPVAGELLALATLSLGKLSERARLAAENVIGHGRSERASQADSRTKGRRSHGNRRSRTPVE